MTWWFPRHHVPPHYIGPWYFQSVNILPHRSVADVWSILLDDSAWSQWHPEVTNIQWCDDKKGGVGASRTIVFRDWLFLLVLFGPVTLLEEFDVWEDDELSPSRKRFSFCITAATRPVWMTYRALREDFLVEAMDGGGSKFTRTVTFDPSFLVRYGLGFILYPYLRHLFEVKCPKRFDRAYNNNSNSNRNDDDAGDGDGDHKKKIT
jgi:hypothetical protein